MTNDLFLAILAMDAYNRTGGLSSQGLILPNGTMLGNATILSGAGGVLEDPSSGFFAQAYEFGDGTKVISYRGTDDFLDMLYGWPIGLAAYDATQAKLAAKFYQQVAAGGADTSNLKLADLYNANIELTGHSLGGGLAGFVGSLYGASDVRIFDNMAYKSAAQNAYDAALRGSFARDAYFLGMQPGQQIDGGDIYSFGVEGQALAGMQSGVEQTTYSLGFDSLVTPISAKQRHSQSLLVIAMFGSTEMASPNWLLSGQYMFPQLFSDDLANKLGIQSGGTTGTDSANGKMRTMIAYSAIDQGVMSYGDVAIRAFYDDANDLGALISTSSRARYLKDDSVLNALAGIAVEYAGLLAVNAERGSSDSNAPTGFEKGALYFDS